MRAFIVFFMTLTLAGFALAAERTFDQKLRGWNQDLSRIEKQLAPDTALSNDDIATIRQTLRQIRLETKEQADLAQSQKDSQAPLLSALGPDPEKGDAIDYRVEAQRKKLKALIADIDSRSKRSALILSKVQEFSTRIDELEKKALRDTLLTRVDWTMVSWTDTAQKASDFITSFSRWDRLAMIVLILATLGYIQTRLPPISQNFLDTLGPLNTRRLFYALMLTVCTFALRVRLLGSEGFVHDGASAILAVALAAMTWLTLRPLRFNDHSEEDDDFRAEKKANYTWIGNGFLSLLRLGLLLVFPAILLGYVSLAVYLAFNITITLAALLSFGVLRCAFLWMMRRFSGEKERNSTVSIIILEPILALFLCMIALSFWGMPPKSLESWLDQYGDGLKIGSTTFDFTNIGSAVLIFFVIYVGTRIAQWFFSERVLSTTRIDGGLKNAVHALTGYVGIGAALLAGLSTLGLNMENITIILGALSVGIGFGLQAITSNFISGLILLFERPIRVGDWVVVGPYQGTVRKIRVRSTEIETFQNASVIVPNSQLITEPVTNWMLHDTVGRVDIIIGVSYDSNLKRAKELLIQAAEEHPEVRKKPEPFVLLQDFGESSLQVEMRCFVKNVRVMQGVASDLRTRIHELFRAEGIEIPFPQRAVRVTGGDAKLAVEA